MLITIVAIVMLVATHITLASFERLNAAAHLHRQAIADADTPRNSMW